jgi:adenylate cyclase
VKGKGVPVIILEPIGVRDELDAQTQKSLDDYHATLALYREQKWDEAEAGFNALRANDPDQMLYELYLDRISHFREEPPGDNWDGVYTHTSK